MAAGTVDVAAAAPISKARERIDGRVRAGAAAADAVPGLSGKIALSRLHLPAGAAMAAERTCHCAGAALLVGARLRLTGVGGLGMSRLFAGLAALALLCITHSALAAPAAPGSVDSVQTPPRPAPPAAAPPPPAIPPAATPAPVAAPAVPPPATAAPAPATRSNTGAASPPPPPRRRHQTRHPPPHKPKRKSQEAPLRALRLLRLPALSGRAVLSLAPAFLVAVQTAALSLRPPAAARVLLPALLALVAELSPPARVVRRQQIPA